jgi:hydrogenase-4 component B
MQSEAQAILIAAIILMIGAGVTAIFSGKRKVVGWLAVGFVALSGVLTFPAALRVMLGAASSTPVLLTVPVLNAQLVFTVDSLSALFLLATAVISFLTTLYSVGYMSRYENHSLARYYPPMLVCFSSILGLICVADWFFFICFWEMMSVSSYALVVFERENPVNLRAGLKYIVMTHTATAAMFVAFIVLWQQGSPHSFSFAHARTALAQLAVAKPLLTHILLALWLIGFGTKAGLLPFGNWLPDAYPAAPSSASAFFGGTMTKLGIYGILRVFCWMLPASNYSQFWGMVIAIVGAGSVFVGTLSTLPHHVAHDDSKRFLSFHAIGQIGYMMLGIGMGIYFLPISPTVAMLALIAGTFHLVNNVIYKSLLFLTSGSILFRTGTRDLNKVSGLGAIMPLTAAAAAVGGLSIAGMPPLNGFASKWMLYGISILTPQIAPIFVILGVMAMFISVVTLASFLKYIGTAFLGPLAAPADNSLERGDVPKTMQIPQAILAALCILFGLLPIIPLIGVYRAINAALPSPALSIGFKTLLGNSPFGIRLLVAGPGEASGVWLPLVGLFVLVVCFLLAWGISRLGGAPQRRVAEWQCGSPLTNQFTRYQARSFYGPFKHAFGRLYPLIGIPKLGYPHSLARFSNFDAWLYAPITNAGLRLSKRLSRTHVGIPQMYLLWQVVGAAAIMILLFVLLGKG